MTDRIEGLRAALEASPDNAALRAVLAETLADAGQVDEALDHYDRLLEARALSGEQALVAGRLALAAERYQIAARCLEHAKSQGALEGVADLQHDLERGLSAGGDPPPRIERSPATPPELQPDELLDEERRITFADVGGLAEVKKTIHRTIILPFQRPDLYLKYGRRAGGGVMMFGAPGCGKTMLARATAGECGLPFFNVRIEDILDPHLGGSEEQLSFAFETARASAPCVIFLDELDALAYARRKQQGFGRSLVNAILQQLDAIGSDNRDLLILGATTAPWDVDDGLKRPGRLDRVLFVPPPDEEARARILELGMRDRPTEGIDIRALVKATPLFSGADLRALVEQATDEVIDEALDSGGEPPMRMAHLEKVLREMRPTTLDWLASARNYVQFANQSGRYDEVAAFLRSRDAKKALKEIAKHDE